MPPLTLYEKNISIQTAIRDIMFGAISAAIVAVLEPAPPPE